MQDLSEFISGNTFCTICLKTSNQAKLTWNSYGDLFQAIQVQPLSPWICSWCVCKTRHFYDLRSRAVRAQSFLQNIKIGLLSFHANEKRHLSELVKVQNEKCVVGDTLVITDMKNTDAKSISRFPKVNVYSHVPWNANLIIQAKSVIEVDLKSEPKSSDEDEPTEPVECEMYDDRPMLEVSLKRCIPKVGDVGDSPLLANMLNTKLREPSGEPLRNDDTVDVCNDSDASPGPSKPTTVSAWDIIEKVSGRKRRCNRTVIERAEALRNDIIAGKKEIVLNERDDMTYITMELNAKYIATRTYTDQEERAAHAEALKREKYKRMKYRCDRCVMGCASKLRFDKHEKKHTPSSGKYMCNLCEAYYPNRVSLRTHMTLHYRTFECVICTERFTSLQHASNHYFVQHSDMTFKCAHCDKSYKSMLYLRKHLYGHTRGYVAPSTSKCNVCNKVYLTTNKDALYRFNNHVREHAEGKLTFLCTVCNKTIVSSRRSNHMKRHVTVVPCPICHKNFQCNETMKLHRHRVHAQEKKYQCDTCGKLFFGKSDVRLHIEWTHLRIGGVECHLCGRKFRRPHLLRSHITQVHDKVPKPKNVLCDLCGKGFGAKPTMEQHRRIHTGERPFACEHCGQRFRQLTAMRTHTKLKHLNIKWSDLKKKRSA